MNKVTESITIKESLSGKVNSEIYKNGIARILHEALSNGKEGVIKPSEYENVDDIRTMSRMIGMGILEPVHLFAPEPLRYVVTDTGRQVHEALAKEGYYKGKK